MSALLQTRGSRSHSAVAFPELSHMSDGILVFRSGRHLKTAIETLRSEYPKCRIAVVSQPGTENFLGEVGVDAQSRFIYESGWPLKPLSFALSATGRKLRRLFARRAFQHVVVLWPDDIGRSHINVSLTGLTFSPRGILAITPSGRIIKTGIMRSLRGLFPHSGGRLGARWRRFWSYLEGPELEPRIWHSHFLSAFAVNHQLPLLSRQLQGSVLDIGAGTGYGSQFLDRNKTRYLPTDLPTGRDPNDSGISSHGKRPAVYCTGYALPFRSASLDAAMSLSVLEHVQDPASVNREAYRVLKSGGKLLVVTPFCFPFHGEPDDFRRWTERGLELELKEAGFTDFQSQRIGDGLSALILNLHLQIKYQYGQSSFPFVHFVVAALSPFRLLMQALLNTIAVVLSRLDLAPRLPLAVAVLATKHEKQVSDRAATMVAGDQAGVAPRE